VVVVSNQEQEKFFQRSVVMGSGYASSRLTVLGRGLANTRNCLCSSGSQFSRKGFVPFSGRALVLIGCETGAAVST
jgi:hypothetical protein